MSTTLTIGAEGVAFGDAMPEPDGLVQPPEVCVTVYVPAVNTVIDDVVSPVDHNQFEPDAVNTELPQLFETVTTGAEGTVNGAAVPEPAGLTHPPTV